MNGNVETYHLIELIAGHRYDFQQYVQLTPFAVYDAMFNAIWYRAAIDLNRIAAALGDPPAVGSEDLRRFKDAYHDVLWN